MILCFGSVNIDDVFHVNHIVVQGETISSRKYDVHSGGKGANQSVAAARAGGKVVHGGKIGKDALWIKQLMADAGVDVCALIVDENAASGRAIIQVSETTHDNAIILYPGTNHTITTEDVRSIMQHGCAGDWLLMQNEVNQGKLAMQIAAEKKMLVVFNPAPMASNLTKEYPMELVNVLIVNETEAIGLLKQLDVPMKDAETSDDLKEAMKLSLDILCDSFGLGMCGLIITLGGLGLVSKFRDGANDEWINLDCPAAKTNVVDTTGAGDTFIGYFLSTLAEDDCVTFVAEKYPRLNIKTVKKALQKATIASSIACSITGAMNSIPGPEIVKERELEFGIVYD
jgi:ribokinase